MSLFTVAAVVISERNALLRFLVSALALGLMFAFTRKAEYRASTSLLVAGVEEGGIGQLRGLASQFGVNVGGLSKGGAISSDLVVKIATSPILLRERALETIVVPELGQKRLAMAEILGIAPASKSDSLGNEKRIRKVVKTLSKLVTASADKKSGAITISATAPQPSVALHLVQSTAEDLDSYFFGLGRRRASAERKAIEIRLDTQQQRLRQAEGALGDFLKKNRVYESSSELRFDYERLQRAVALQQQVLVSLSQSREEILSREIQAAPTITVLEPALAPVTPESRNRLRIVLLSLVSGVLLGLIWVFVKHSIKHLMASDTSGVRAFRHQIDALRARAHGSTVE